MSAYKIRAVQDQDYPQWRKLYLGYADFYKVETNDAKLTSLWHWLINEDHVVNGLVASSEDGDLAGLAHYRSMPSPLRGCEIGFLDDLFVHPDSRGQGIAKALLSQLSSIAEKNGWDLIRWITAEDNDQAKAVYDQVATLSKWQTYELLNRKHVTK